MANYIRFVDEMSADDAIEIIKTHVDNWERMEEEERKNSNYHSAQSYKDMAFAGRALIEEITRKMVE